MPAWWPWPTWRASAASTWRAVAPSLMRAWRGLVNSADWPTSACKATSAWPMQGWSASAACPTSAIWKCPSACSLLTMVRLQGWTCLFLILKEPSCRSERGAQEAAAELGLICSRDLECSQLRNCYNQTSHVCLSFSAAYATAVIACGTFSLMDQLHTTASWQQLRSKRGFVVCRCLWIGRLYLSDTPQHWILLEDHRCGHPLACKHDISCQLASARLPPPDSSGTCCSSKSSW